MLGVRLVQKSEVEGKTDGKVWLIFGRRLWSRYYYQLHMYSESC